MSPRALFIILLFSCTFSWGQTRIVLPPHFDIQTNDSSLSFSQTWYDSLRNAALNTTLAHSICAFHVDEEKVFTKIRLPQTYNKIRLVECLLLYYAMLGSEQDRLSEQVLIYPYFIPVDVLPHVQCIYNRNNQLNILFRNWEPIPYPEEPGLIEKTIYNQVLSRSFSQTTNFNEIPQDVLELIADKHDIYPAQVKEIYQNVFLWNKGN